MEVRIDHFCGKKHWAPHCLPMCGSLHEVLVSDHGEPSASSRVRLGMKCLKVKFVAFGSGFAAFGSRFCVVRHSKKVSGKQLHFLFFFFVGFKGLDFCFRCLLQSWQQGRTVWIIRRFSPTSSYHGDPQPSTLKLSVWSSVYHQAFQGSKGLILRLHLKCGFI